MTSIYPSLEQYLQTVQESPRNIFTDYDLKNSSVEKNVLDIPRVRSGNFAAIFKYTKNNKHFAVRCFLNKSFDVEARYYEISRAVKKTPSIFSDFDFQKNGILVDKKWYPILKMSWIDGPTLGEFINTEHNNPIKLSNLRKSLQELQSNLERNEIAHGDIQPGNLIILDHGKKIKLIDYDGMYTPKFQDLQAQEIGHINFQHPLRKIKHFSKKLDWFSFIQLDVSITCLIANSDLWEKTYSDEEGILFRSNDLKNPQQSETFFKIFNDNKNLMVKEFASICLNDFNKIPHPKSFYEEQFITDKIIVFEPDIDKKLIDKNLSVDKRLPYIGANKVLEAKNINKIDRNIGKRVEMIGLVYDVRGGKKQFGNNLKLRPYIFLDFNNVSQGHVFRIKYLPELIESDQILTSQLPNEKWINKWVTITEIIQPTNIINHPSFSSGFRERSIIVNNINQIKILSESEAMFRLNDVDKFSELTMKIKEKTKNIFNKKKLNNNKKNAETKKNSIKTTITKIQNKYVIEKIKKL